MRRPVTRQLKSNLTAHFPGEDPVVTTPIHQFLCATTSFIAWQGVCYCKLLALRMSMLLDISGSNSHALSGLYSHALIHPVDVHLTVSFASAAVGSMQ